VLLDEIRHQCRDLDLVVVEVIASLPTAIAEQIAAGFRAALDAQRGLLDSIADRIDSISVAVGIPGARVEVTGRGPDARGTTATIRQLGAICRTIREHGRPGAVVIIDELQSAQPECLAWLVPAFQEVLRDPQGAPLLFLGAGLEYLPRTLSSAGGFAERFDYVQLERLSDVDASLALRLNVESEDVRWSPSAVDAAIEAAAGSPYLIQLIGHHAWNESGARSAISVAILEADVDTAVQLSQSDIRQVFEVRWVDAGELDRLVLGVIAGATNPMTRREISAAVRLSMQEVERTVAMLYNDGWLDVVDLEQVRLAYSGLSEMIRARSA
jgi:hypothetical protein